MWSNNQSPSLSLYFYWSLIRIFWVLYISVSVLSIFPHGGIWTGAYFWKIDEKFNSSQKNWIQVFFLILQKNKKTTKKELKVEFSWNSSDLVFLIFEKLNFLLFKNNRNTMPVSFYVSNCKRNFFGCFFFSFCRLFFLMMN